MKSNTENIVTLAEDIRYIIEKEYGNELQLIRLCRDHKEPLLLNDKRPVLNISQDEFVGIFDMNIHHFFLPPDQLFRLGIYCKTPIPNVTALMLKAIWESFLADMAGYYSERRLRLEDILKDTNLIRTYAPDFKPHMGKMFRLFKDAEGGSFKNIDFDSFAFIVDDLLSENTFLLGYGGISAKYPKEDVPEWKLLKGLPTEKRDRYIYLKDLWNLKSAELEDMLMKLERKKRLNMSIENRYFQNFGTLEVKKSEFSYRVEKYTKVLELMIRNPGLSFREAKKQAVTLLQDAAKERRTYLNKLSRSQNCIDSMIPEDSRHTATADFKKHYIEACKKLLKKIYFLLHTDTRPEVPGQSPEKKRAIDDLWFQVMKTTSEEDFSFSPNMLLYNLPDYNQLEDIYLRTCKILEIDPDDFKIGNRLEFMIAKGSSMESILDFLQGDLDRLELQLANLDLVQNDYTHEIQTQLYREALANINAHSGKLEADISELKQKMRRIRKKIFQSNPKVQAG